ncbi:hypothetical protein ACTXMB_13220 [Arthrobacter rhombi]|uniref:hypothetical protein n=1 Tax=Arthrobacter rhombi TaxID=71253 RepID=UPI003FD684CF
MDNHPLKASVLSSLVAVMLAAMALSPPSAFGAPATETTVGEPTRDVGIRGRDVEAIRDSVPSVQPPAQNDEAPKGETKRAQKTKDNTAPRVPKKQASRVTAKSPKYKVSYSTTCALQFGGNGSCKTFDEAPCPDNQPLKVRTIRTPAGALVSRDTYCKTEPPPQAPEGSPAQPEDLQRAVQEQRTIEVTPAEFQSFPIRGSQVDSQPSGFSLRNGHAQMYATPNPQTFNVEIFDEPVRVRAIPQSYLWNYGDGHSRKLQKPGKPMPNHTFDQPTDTSHVYEETGDFTIQLSTAYRGEYSVDGGPWMPIPGTASVPSDPMPMSVWRTKKLLVDQDCANNPGGPACDSPFLREKSAAK